MLERRLGFWPALATNVLAMVGAGPFITIPLLLGAMGGPQAMLGWIVGALVAICDGLAWAELGAAIPQAGGGYRYLLDAYGPHGAGRLMSFLFLWQAVTITPLFMASGAVGFAGYSTYLFPALSPVAMKALAMFVCLIATALIYRRVETVGRLGTVFGLVIAAVGLWIIVDGLVFGRSAGLQLPPGALEPSRQFWIGLGGATLYAMYDYAGYQTVCSVGGEVVRPAATIPRSIVVAVVLVASLYIAMNFSILSVLPWDDVMRSGYVVSDYIARLHGPAAASVMTVLILVVIFAGLFAGMLGGSRIPYAAAEGGRFFAVFARLHPTGRFPSFAVLFIGLASALCCLFPLDALIQASIVISVMIQSLPMLGAAVARRRRETSPGPFRMWLYPLPVAVAATGWLAILVAAGATFVLLGLAVMIAGIAAYFVRARRVREWPWAPSRSDVPE